MPNEQALSYHLKRLRMVHGLTQLKAAQIMHVSRSTYGKYERGNAYPGRWSIQQIALYYGVSVEALYAPPGMQNV